MLLVTWSLCPGTLCLAGLCPWKSDNEIDGINVTQMVSMMIYFLWLLPVVVPAVDDGVDAAVEHRGELEPVRQPGALAQTAHYRGLLVKSYPELECVD